MNQETEVNVQTSLEIQPLQKSFQGPLFIIGMPRSGTKLLRSLLSSHDSIRILPAESEFLPYWVNNWHRFGDLSNRTQFKRFYKQVQSLPYFIYTQNRDSQIRQEKWYNRCQSFTPSGVFEGLMRCDNDVAYGSRLIWGDKSPSYINHIPLLKKLYPNGKIIHIIRDVRDYCLSNHKAWKKNTARAAQRWVNSIAQAKQDSEKFASDYLEIKYENLLDRPEETLKRCCNFLSITFEPEMLQLSKSPENIGDAKGYQVVKSDNKGKYRDLMPPQELEKIEAIAVNMLKKLDYDVSYSGIPITLSPLEMSYLRVFDGLNLLKEEFKRRKSVKRTFKLFVGNYMS